MSSAMCALIDKDFSDHQKAYIAQAEITAEISKIKKTVLYVFTAYVGMRESLHHLWKAEV